MIIEKQDQKGRFGSCGRGGLGRVDRRGEKRWWIKGGGKDGEWY